MDANEKRVMTEALSTYGSFSQMNMAIEEMAELTVALSHWKRARQVKVEEVITEIADVKIMMDQLSIFFGEEAVEKERQRKIERLDGRLRDV